MGERERERYTFLLVELLIGFIKPMLEIREGETGEAMISILNPSEVAVSIRVQVQLADNANSKSKCKASVPCMCMI